MVRPAARPTSPPRFAGLAFGRLLVRRQRDRIAFAAGAGYEGAGVLKKTAMDIQTIQNWGVPWIGLVTVDQEDAMWCACR